jgi:hypothetical protein
MLKIGVVRWRGKCSRHPSFDPCFDVPGAIKGGCARCEALVEIYDLHRRMVALMRGFAPPVVKEKSPDRFEERQTRLFG